MKALHPICAANSVSQFPAGHYYDSNIDTMTRFTDLNYIPRVPKCVNTYTGKTGSIHAEIRTRLEAAVKLRLHTSERPVGCFLSGGLDSSLVAAIASKLVKERSNGKKQIKTFSVGIKGSTDLEAARQVATWIASDHHELVVTEKEMIKAVPAVIKRIESYDVTTVRASTPMILLSDWIKENFETTVLFSGEGADELSGSYRYFQKAPDATEFRMETVRLVKDLQYFDVLRCDKSVSGSGLEARTPFFDMDFVDFYMRVDPALKMWGGNTNKIEKQLLRESFEPLTGERGLLPTALLNRRKEAFSDGCSSLARPWFQVIEEHVNSIISDPEYDERRRQYTTNMPISKEGYWFRAIFEQFYPGRGTVVPYIWRPKWTTETNPSARLLINV
jgi:asparagine synthase (glutamine-hydrolysing)